MEDVVCLTRCLLLFVDEGNISDELNKLSNSNVKDKSAQGSLEIINKSWVLYNNILNNKINEEIDNKFYSITDIECNEYNENENVLYKIISSRKLLVKFREYLISKHNEDTFANLELNKIIEEVVEEYFRNQQQTTTKTLSFNKRKPSTFVLKRLEIIGIELASYDKVIFTNNELKQLIINSLENPDRRTIIPYYDCLIDYAKQTDKVIGGFNEVRFNMRGFLETVRSTRGSKTC